MRDKKLTEATHLDCVKGDLYCNRKDGYHVKARTSFENTKHTKNSVKTRNKVEHVQCRLNNVHVIFQRILFIPVCRVLLHQGIFVNIFKCPWFVIWALWLKTYYAEHILSKQTPELRKNCCWIVEWKSNWRMPIRQKIDGVFFASFFNKRQLETNTPLYIIQNHHCVDN